MLKITTSQELLDENEIKERVEDALVMFSKNRPQVGRYEAIGNAEHEVELPTSWVNDFSVLRKIEFPAGAQASQYIDDNEIIVNRVDTTTRTIATATILDTSLTMSTIAQAGFFKDGEIVTISDDDASETNWVASNGNTTTGVVELKNAIANTYDATPLVKKKDHITFITTAPLESEYYSVEFSLPHTHTDTSDTIPDNDFEAFTWLAASLCAWSIAAEFSKGTSSGFEADSVNLVTNSERWEGIAEGFEERYNDYMGIDDDSGQPAVMSIIDTDSNFSHGRQFLFHPRRLI